MTGAMANQLPVARTSRKKLSKAGQKTAEEILVAAENLFTRKGFKATTLKEVSEISGANTALISYYFGNKDGLRNAVFARQIKLAGSGFEELEKIEPTSYTLESFKSLIHFFLDRGSESDTLYRLNTWATVDNGEIADQMFQMIWQPFAARLTDIAEHLAEGSLTRNEAESRVWALLGSLHGFVHFRWHSVKHVKTLDAEDVFLKRYGSLIVDKVADNLFRK
jgi:AcrR family transcriptional regulator